MTSFVIAEGNEERLELKVVTQLKGKELEDEGFAFGLWLWALALGFGFWRMHQALS